MCTVCAEAHYLQNDKCFKGAISNCKSYSSPSTCSACLNGHVLIQTVGNKQLCIPINTHDNCSQFEPDLLLLGKLKC